jgi:hypothetical protein
MGLLSLRVGTFCVALLSVACTSPSPPATEREAERAVIKVMTFNVEYGGEEVDFDSVIRAIRKSDADVVGIEEAWGTPSASLVSWGGLTSTPECKSYHAIRC